MAVQMERGAKVSQKTVVQGATAEKFFLSYASLRIRRQLRLVCFALALLASFGACKAGTWTPLARTAPDGVGTMLLLSDGTVMCQNANSWDAWFLLKPDTHGSYTNGTWTKIAPMHDTRLYYASAILRDGRLLVAGAEYGTGGPTAEIYDPSQDTWTLTASASVPSFYDAISKILPDGNVLIAPVGAPNTTIIYNVASNTWSGPQACFGSQDEVSWVKLPDDSIITIDRDTTSSERYIPSLNKWIHDASLPVQLYDGSELGAGLLLPNGKAFFLGANGNTALYTPSGGTNAGSWVAGPVTPGSAGAPDAPAAWMVNGKVLCTLVPPGSNSCVFCEYDPVANSFTSINSPEGTANYPYLPYYTRMLDLPDGTVLYTRSGNQLYTYNPGAAPLAAAKPSISSLTTNLDGSYHLIGTLFNGISEGAAYGDDAQMDSNFPLVRLTDGAGNVYYARTYNWSTTSVMTGNKPVSTDFVVPQEVPAGAYSLVVVANGVASGALSFFSGSLRISPGTNYTWSGPSGGPFTGNTQSFTLTNVGTAPLFWTLTSTSAWLTVTATAGNLGAGGVNAAVVASLNLSASNLVAGTYSTVLVFSNVTEHTSQTRRFTLAVGLADQPLLFFGNNAGLIGPANATGGNTAPYLTAMFGGMAFYAAGLNANNFSGGSTTNEGLPPSGQFTSLYDGATVFQLGTYGTGTNTLLLSPFQGLPGSATLTVKNPRPLKSLSILASSGNGYSASAGAGNLVLHFTNGISSSPIPFYAPDWFQPDAHVALIHFGRIYPGNYGVFYADNPLGNFPNLCHTKIDLGALGYATQTIGSITFTMPPDTGAQNEDTAIFALSGSLSAMNTVPAFTSVKKTNSVLNLSWSTVPGLKYYLQYKTNLSQSAWNDLSLATVAAATSMSLSDPVRPGENRLYRAVLQP
jgi:hypothetical protein